MQVADVDIPVSSTILAVEEVPSVVEAEALEVLAAAPSVAVCRRELVEESSISDDSLFFEATFCFCLRHSIDLSVEIEYL